MILKKINNLQSVIWQENDQFVAQCLSVDVSSFGSSREEAETNLTEALELYFEDNADTEIPKITSVEVISSDLVI